MFSWHNHLQSRCDSSMTPTTIPVNTGSLWYGYPAWKRLSLSHRIWSIGTAGTSWKVKPRVWMPHTNGVIPRTRASPPCRFATAGYPATQGSTGCSGCTHDPSLTGMGMRPRPEIERELNLLRYRNMLGSLGCTVPGHLRCAAKGGRFVRSTAPTIYHLPSTIYLPPIIYHLLRSVCIVCLMRW